MSRYEAWSLVFAATQAFGAVLTLIVAGAALRTWKQQIDYAALSEVASRTARLLTLALTAIREARDSDFYTFLDEGSKSGYNVTEENEPLFWAIFSTYQILNDNKSVFDGLEQAAVDLLFLSDIDISDEVNEIKEIRYRLMTASMKAAKIRFASNNTRPIDENELQMYEDDIFSRQGDDLTNKVDNLSEIIKSKLRSAYRRPFLT